MANWEALGSPQTSEDGPDVSVPAPVPDGAIAMSDGALARPAVVARTFAAESRPGTSADKWPMHRTSWFVVTASAAFAALWATIAVVGWLIFG